jgi:Protein of unknown function (DUF3108)
MMFQRIATALLLAGVLTTPALAAGGESADAPAGPVSTIALGYELYISGLTLGHVDVSARIQGGGYQAQSTLDTKGLISIFWQAHIEASANGRLGPGMLKPALYDAYSTHRDKHQQVTMTYGPSGPIMVEATPPYSKKYPVSEEQQRNTVDPLSAMLFVLTGVTANEQNPCGTAAPIYDGRRRYDVQLVYVRTKSVTMDNGAYAGPALVCQIKYIQIAGFKQKILEEGKRLPQMFAWIVSMPSRSDPTRRFLVPVKLWAETDWGTATAVASRIQLDGANVAKAS